MLVEATDKGAAFLRAHHSQAYMQLHGNAEGHAFTPVLPVSTSSVAPSHLAKLKAGAFNCPFEGCPYSREHLSKYTLVSHLSARHVSSGQVVPLPALKMLKHAACYVCKTLHKEGASCQCHGPQLPDGLMDGSPAVVSPPDVPPDRNHGQHTPLSNDCPGTLLPSFEDLLAARIPTVRRIPGACQRGVAASLASLVSSFVHNPSWESLHSLQCFPKLVLRAPKRAGKAHAKQLAADIARRLRLFEAGHCGLKR